MAGIIQKIITLYEIEASEIGSLVTNSQKVFENSAPESQRTADRWSAKTLTRNGRALTRHLDSAEDDTFEKRIDNEIKQMEADVKERLKHFKVKAMSQ